MRQVLFDPLGGADEIHRVIVVLLKAGANSENIWIENNVLGRKTDLVYQQPIAAVTNFDSALVRIRLSALIKRHHHHGGSVAADQSCVLEEFLLTFLQRN